MYKLRHGIAPDIMNDIFRKRSTSSNTRNPSSFETRNFKTVYYELEKVTYLAPKIRKLAPQMTKYTENINFFDSNTKLQKPENYPSRLFKFCSQLVPFKYYSFITFSFVLIGLIVYMYLFFLYENFVLIIQFQLFEFKLSLH